ncbi:DUF5134 domain-containing protein [Nocardioides panacis]|uniref:DUF5134 domain-containing protein n=1 Tax=Nocardioides panacis TaxID=2849501 RepID=A0A975SZS3_9ACTN|nr:DUF5134 domain-containing protein [Nocardioides panacis]QWZ08415.1 DUF5134 domain-containing protein [Nocardioides panacis]
MDAPVAHPRDVTAWHGASAVCMALMLVAAVPGWFAGAGTALFAAGLGWCGVQLARRTSPATYLRLGVCCLAMVLMLRPRDAGAATHAGHAGHEMAMPAAGPSAGAVLVALALLAVVVLAVREAAVASGRGTSRLGPACEGVLAGSMAVMLVGLV